MPNDPGLTPGAAEDYTYTYPSTIIASLKADPTIKWTYSDHVLEVITFDGCKAAELAEFNYEIIDEDSLSDLSV